MINTFRNVLTPDKISAQNYAIFPHLQNFLYFFCAESGKNTEHGDEHHDSSQ